LDSGTFSGTQKLLTTRCQTSRSVWSSTAFQLIAFFGSIRGLSAVIAVSLRGGVGSARHNTPKGRDGYLRPGVSAAQAAYRRCGGGGSVPHARRGDGGAASAGASTLAAPSACIACAVAVRRRG